MSFTTNFFLFTDLNIYNIIHFDKGLNEIKNVKSILKGWKLFDEQVS